MDTATADDVVIGCSVGNSLEVVTRQIHEKVWPLRCVPVFRIKVNENPLIWVPICYCDCIYIYIKWYD